MPDWIRTQGDQLHSLYAQLSDDTGPTDIPPGTAVEFSGRLMGENTPRIDGPGVVVRPGAFPDDPNRGLVRYDPSTQDMATPGIYYCQFQLTPPGYAQHQSFPEDSYLVLLIQPQV